MHRIGSRPADGVLCSGPDGGRSGLAFLVDGVELDVKGGPALVIKEIGHTSRLNESFHRGETGGFGALSGAHELHYRVAAGDLDHRLTSARGARCPDLIVDKETGPDEGRVTDPAGDLEEQAGGGGGATHVTVSIDGAKVDGSCRANRAVLLDEPPDIGILGLAGGREPIVAVGHVGLPVEPDLARLFGEEVLLFETDGPGEAGGAVTDQENPGCPLKDLERHLCRVAEPFNGGNRTGAHGGAIHTA